jgi:hypothetical protein
MIKLDCFGLFLFPSKDSVQRYGFNGMEGDDELISSASDFGARILNRSLGRWFTTDCHYYNYYSTSPFVFGINNPNAFIDADGYDVVVAFTGGPTGGGKPVEPVNAGSTGDIMVSAQANALAKDVEFSGLIVAPGATAESAVQTAYEFIKANHSTGEKLLIYAYSYGVDPAVDLCERLKSDGIIVDLLITVDGSDGPFQNYTVNTSIPDNVSRNVNWYQTNNSGLSSSSWSTNSTSSGGSDSSSGSSSHSGSLNFPGSSGGPNTAQDAQKTVLDNVDLTSPLVNHANIPTWTRSTNIQLIQSIIGTGIKGNSNPPKALEPLDLNFKPTPAVQDNTAVGSGQGF